MSIDGVHTAYSSHLCLSATREFSLARSKSGQCVHAGSEAPIVNQGESLRRRGYLGFLEEGGGEGTLWEIGT